MQDGKLPAIPGADGSFQVGPDVTLHLTSSGEIRSLSIRNGVMPRRGRVVIDPANTEPTIDGRMGVLRFRVTNSDRVVEAWIP